MKYEYKILKIDTGGFLGGKFDEVSLEKQLNDLGKDGWELMASFSTNQSYGQTRNIAFLFKRASQY